MPIKTIAIQSPGDMGHGVGRVLAEGGYRVVSALEGRSERTRGLAKAAGIEDIGPLSALLDQADVVLSIMRPDRALGFVEELADMAREHTGRPLIVDLNAVAPATGRAAARAAEAAGLNFVDGGIIGGPPRPGSSYTPRLYVSGPRAGELEVLNRAGLDFRVLGDGIGAGSAIKMCYAALTKGLTAIGIHSMVTARLEGVEEALMAELASSQENLLRHLERGLPDMCPKAYRWVGEMEEISKTHRDGGLPDEMFIGAAKVYAQVEASPLGAEIVEDRKRGKTMGEVAEILAEHIDGRDKAAE
jgi:3-hydroxyisobutyrate dehydrogenase-like beta-hydroxyacid dehydrogenase